MTALLHIWGRMRQHVDAPAGAAAMRRTARRRGTEPRFPNWTRIVSRLSKADRARDRAARLRSEASNCLSIAIRERDTALAARLIDEAVTLARRSAELVEPDKAGPAGP